MKTESGSLLEYFAAEAIRLGADEIEVEYKDRHEIIFANKNGFGFGIGRLPGSGPEAEALRDELWASRRRKRTIVVDGLPVDLRVTPFDSFGETAFRVSLVVRSGHKQPSVAKRSRRS